jgi:hypothetical protein
VALVWVVGAGVELGTVPGRASVSDSATGLATVQISAGEALARFPNVELWERDTKAPALIVELRQVGPFDVLFIDTHHTPEQAGF